MLYGGYQHDTGNGGVGDVERADVGEAGHIEFLYRVAGDVDGAHQRIVAKVERGDVVVGCVKHFKFRRL